jgi:hypothetical protein
MRLFRGDPPERNYPCHLLNHETSDHLLSLVNELCPLGHDHNMSHLRLGIKPFVENNLRNQVAVGYQHIIVRKSAIVKCLYN